jgi:hypothetical protein
MAAEKTKIERIHCNSCGQQTKHLQVASRKQYGSEPCGHDYEISWNTNYDMFECCGCEEVTLRSEFYFSEWDHGESKTTYYPPRIARQLPPWKDELENEILGLLEEVYVALQADSRALSMMGARALIDMVILQEVGDAGSFAQKLTKLQKNGFLSEVNKGILQAALEVGNAASHRGYRPESNQINTVMDIVEHLLHSTILKKESAELEKSTPRRKNKKHNQTGDDNSE